MDRILRSDGSADELAKVESLMERMNAKYCPGRRT